MHEHSLIKNLIKKIETIAYENDAKTVKSFKIKLGALSHTTPEHFKEHFYELSNGSIAEKAEIEFIVSKDLDDPLAQEIVLESVEVEDN